MGSETKALHAHVCTECFKRLCHHQQGLTSPFISFHLSHNNSLCRHYESDKIIKKKFKTYTNFILFVKFYTQVYFKWVIVKRGEKFAAVFQPFKQTNFTNMTGVSCCDVLIRTICQRRIIQFRFNSYRSWRNLMKEKKNWKKNTLHWFFRKRQLNTIAQLFQPECCLPNVAQLKNYI